MLKHFLPLTSVGAIAVLAMASACTRTNEAAVYAGSDLTLDDLPVKVTAPVEGTFDQPIDHPTASPTDGAPLPTFKQRYWYTTEFADGPDSPVLFNFCGEAPCSKSELSFMSDVAKVLHASIVALEHRYYGKSTPYEDLSLEHMKYLSVHNALEDMITFQAFAKRSLPLSGKWVAVGGSYSGMLAAFLRQKHPEAVVGAWASSAPVNIQKSFPGYDALCSHALGPRCTLLFQQILEAAGRAFDDPAQRQVLSQKLFAQDWPDTADKKSFLESIAGFAQEDAQYGQEARFCQALEQHSLSPLDGLVAYVTPPIASDPGAADAGIVAPPAARAPDGMRALLPGRPAPAAATGDFAGSEWFYQTCTELGLFAVSNPDRTESVLPSGVDEAESVSACVQLTHSDPDVSIARQTYYAPLVTGQASNIFYVNGTLDPWSALGFTDPVSPPPGATVFTVAGGSHCTDLLPLKSTSLIGDFEARAKAVELIRGWLAD